MKPLITQTERFNKAVVNRANQRVQERIKIFKQEFANALNKLYANNYGFHYDICVSQINVNKDVQKICEILSKPRVEQKWPKSLWQDEEERVHNELFSLLDPLQQAINSPDPLPTDEQSNAEEL